MNIHKIIEHTLCLACIVLTVGCMHEPIDGSNELDVQLVSKVRSVAPTGDEEYFVLPNQTDFTNIPQDPKNPITWEKVELGKMLFFETGIALDAKYVSGKGTYSCASCHVPSAGFTPGASQGIADGGIGFGLNGEAREISPLYQPEELDIQGNRPLSVLNVAYVKNTFWNGQFGGNDANEGTDHLWTEDHGTHLNHLGYLGMETQNIEGLKAHRMSMTKEIAEDLGYKHYYDRAFADWEENERYDTETTALAISAYLRTLTTDEAPFQMWLKGDRRAMTESQKHGAMLFFGDAQCFYCHKSPALQSNEFHALGVKGIYQLDNPIATDKNDRRNLGRGGFTENPDDYFKFQVPQLYNLKHAGFYFHGSSKHSIREVIEYKSKAQAENPDVPQHMVSSQLEPTNLSDSEIKYLTDFVENALYDPNYQKFVPEHVLSGNCFPNNDPMSKAHLDCD